MNPGDIIRGCFDAFALCLPPGEYSGPDEVGRQILSGLVSGTDTMENGSHDEQVERADLLIHLAPLCSPDVQSGLLDQIESLDAALVELGKKASKVAAEIGNLDALGPVARSAAEAVLELAELLEVPA